MKKNFTLLIISIIGFSCLAQTPELVKEVPNPAQFTSFKNQTFFVSDRDVIWVTDGTTNGTHTLGNISSAYTPYPFFVGEYKERLYFTINDGTNGTELWSTDGTEAGTKMLKDINPSGDSNPRGFTVAGTNLYFTAYDPINGREWWVSDGTTEGTHLTTNTNTTAPTSGELNDPGFKQVCTLGNSIVFSRLINNEDVFVFISDENSATNLTEQFNPLYYKSQNASKMISYNNKVYFNFKNGNEGDELFVTDGTIAGTKMLEFVVGENSFFPEQFFLFKDKLCFAGYTTGTGCCTNLYISDGTVEGATNLNVTVVGLTNIESAPNYVIANDKIYFSGRDDANGYELWQSDGTPEGTVMIKDIYPGTSNSSPGDFAFCNNKIYFTAQDGTNETQPWVSDGTAEGTTMIKNIYSGRYGSYVNNFTELDGKVYFTARTGFNDFHLFETDGTEVGTKIIEPVDATNFSSQLGDSGSTVSYATPIKVTNGIIYFSADYHNNGRNLYRLGGSNLAVNHFDSLKEHVFAFPNPSNGILELQFDNIQVEKGTVEVYNMLGEKMYSASNVNQQNKIDLSQLSRGVYFLKIYDGTKYYNQKIIIQ